MTTFKDSGERHLFGTGAVRDIQDGKGRFDLMPYDPLHQLACVYETGCLKYGDRNWEKGIPCSRYVNSALRHLGKAAAGAIDENHLPMAMWNISCAIQTYIWVRDNKLPEELADIDMALFEWESLTSPVGVVPPEADQPDTKELYVEFPADLKEGETVEVEIKGQDYTDHNKEAADVFTSWCGSMHQEVDASPIDDEGVKYDLDTCEKFLRIECILGHEVKFIDEERGYIDGEYLRGTEFKTKVRLYRDGFQNQDEAVKARYMEEMNATILEQFHN